ncbi:hypothetical protein LTS17_011685 [Exophiala oligosperma]
MKSIFGWVLLASTYGVAFSEFVTKKNGLQVDVYHQPPAGVVYQNSTDSSFSPTAFTLIHGEHDAILVDSPATIAQGHIIQQSYPGAQVVAKKDVYDHMLQQYEPAVFKSVWASLFPGGQVTDTPLAAKVLSQNGTFHLEGHVLQAVEVGQSDTYNTTALHVPDLDLVVGGDVIYGHCHQLFAEDSSHELRQKWLISLDEAAALNPKVVVPSHMQAHDRYQPSHINETKRHIHFWEQLLANSSSWQELEAKVKKAFPLRTGNFVPRWSSQAPFSAAF